MPGLVARFLAANSGPADLARLKEVPGNSLGMALGESSHNLGDNDREIMDSGQNRSFEERAELDGYLDRPSGFSEEHQKYLGEILPR